MFKEKYKRANAAVILTDESKVKIREDIRNNKKPHDKMVWLKVAVVAVACICLVITATIILLPSNSDETKVRTTQVSNYSQIYKKLKELNRSEYVEYYNKNGISKDEVVLYNEGTIGGISEPSKGETSNFNAGDETHDYSETNVQVKGVDEADIVKTNGEYIYAMSRKEVFIYKVDGSELKYTARIYNENYDKECAYEGMYLYNNMLILNAVGEEICDDEYLEWNSYSEKCYTLYYDISVPKSPKLVSEIEQDGSYSDSRLTNGVLYTVSQMSAYYSWDEVVKSKPSTYIPGICDAEGERLIDADDITILEDVSRDYYVLTAVDLKDTSKIKTSIAMLGQVSGMFASHDNIVLYNNCSEEETQKVRFGGNGNYDILKDDANSKTYLDISSYKAKLYLIHMNDGEIKQAGTQELNGRIDDQFSIDEYNGYFRVVTTSDVYKYFYDKEWSGSIFDGVDENSAKYTSINGRYRSNNLYVLDGELKITGEIDKIADDEEIKSARFMGDVGFFVTFRQTDPLFSVDLKDPKNPKILGTLKIPGFSEYLQSYGDGLLFGFGYAADEFTGGTYGIKLSMFDINDLTDVKELSNEILYNEYSVANGNHKAILADSNKNLIGFPGGNCYYIYSYDNANNTFKLSGEIECDTQWSYSMRGLYIDEYYYVVDIDSQTIKVLDLTTFKEVNTYKFGA